MGSKSNNYEIYPFVYRDGEWSIPDEILLAIWAQIINERKMEILFYDGGIKTPYEWLEFIKRPGTFPILIVDKKKNAVVHIIWLKDVFDIGAWIHHCSLGKYQRGVWEAARDYWRKYFPKLKLLLGVTPVNNIPAVKILTKICKFTVLGEIPNLCNMVYENKRVNGLISYFEL